MKLFNYKRALFPLLFTALINVGLLSACGSEGIDRAELLDDPSTASEGQSSIPNTNLTASGPNRFVQLEKLSFEATLPSIISVLFQATDQFGGAIAGLQTSDFLLLEDDEPVSAAETSLAIVPQEQLPFSLRTVIMIDISSSISPTDLDQIKDAVLGVLTNSEGQSNLLPQQEIALYTFNDTVTLLSDFTGNIDNLVARLESISPAVAITPTDLYGAVITGASRIENTFDITEINQGNLIIITDGTDTAARNTFDDALDAVRGKSVYTLGVGSEITEEILREFGTSGTFALRNFAQLSATLSSINQQVVDTANSFYFLHYASPKRAATGAEDSIHEMELSVVNNANRGRSSVITDEFDATGFSNVQPEIIITGPNRLELQEAGIYRATTRWGPQPFGDYLWRLTEDNTSCQIDRISSTSIRVTAVATGNCTLIAEDQSAGGVQGWFSINVVAD